jgi:hypothetical protein
MKHWTKMLVALAAPVLLTGCLWGPGKFASELTLKKDGSFVLDYRGEIVIQLPPDADEVGKPWTPAMARCFVRQSSVIQNSPSVVVAPPPPKPPATRPCTRDETAVQKREYEERAGSQRKQSEDMAKVFGLPGLDDESNRAFAAKLMKYAGYRSVAYRGKGVFDIDYHMEGSAKQDFIFPAFPDDKLLIPFVALRRRSDGSVLVTAPAFTGGAGPLGAGAAAADMAKRQGPVSRAEGRFTIVTDGEILTNNSEDGPSAGPRGRQLHWDVSASSSNIPEALIRLQ